MAIAYIGVGSNIGDREKNCAVALKHLDHAEGVKVEKVSELYFTEPVGGPPQDKYLNGVAKINTDLSPRDLLTKIKGIEKEIGRAPVDLRDLPRIIDLDILIYEDVVLDEKGLRIPHPRMHKRNFILKGFNEIAPDTMHPGLGKTIKELYNKMRHPGTPD